MITQLNEINVTLSDNQKEKLSKAFHNREIITLRLKNDALSGSDTLLVPSTTVKRLEKNRMMNKGMEIKLSSLLLSYLSKRVCHSGSETTDFEQLVECGADFHCILQK